MRGACKETLMKIYLDPVSTTSLPLLMFLAEHDSGAELVPVSLQKGEHKKPEYVVLNPNGSVPTLQDGDFVLTESSAILKYLAEKTRSRTYPEDLKARAHVNEVMDWFNTNLYQHLGYGVVYPQVLREMYGFANPDTQADVVRRGEERTDGRLAILNDHWLRKGGFLCGPELTIADYLGSSVVATGDWVDYNISNYPNVVRWMDAIKSRPSWEQTRRDWHGAIAYVRAQRQNQA
jgi:glutathione S-transferase